MSILIKGTKIPQGCFSADGICFAYDGVECHCRLVPGKIIHFSTRVKNERPSWCPLVEVKPHGRLIDADMLTTVTEMVNGEFKTYIEVFEVVDAPTIIEAEGENG